MDQMPKQDEFVSLVKEVCAHFESDVVDVIKVPEVPDVPKKDECAGAQKEL